MVCAADQVGTTVVPQQSDANILMLLKSHTLHWLGLSKPALVAAFLLAVGIAAAAMSCWCWRVVPTGVHFVQHAAFV